LKRILLALWLLLICTAAAPTRGAEAVIPVSDPAYADIRFLDDTFRESYGDGTLYGPMTPKEFAICTAALFKSPQIMLILSGASLPAPKMLIPSPSSPWYSPEPLGPSAVPSVEWLEMRERLQLAATRLVRRFRPELKALGLRVEDIKINGEFVIKPVIVKPFSDVAQNHRAYEAIETLRQSGIVVGYLAPRNFAE